MARCKWVPMDSWAWEGGQTGRQLPWHGTRGRARCAHTTEARVASTVACMLIRIFLKSHVGSTQICFSKRKQVLEKDLQQKICSELCSVHNKQDNYLSVACCIFRLPYSAQSVCLLNLLG